MDLVEGWPVDYSDSKISFLLRDGNELVMFLNDPIVIKRELVRLKEGHEQILEYEQDQKFYPVPQLFENRTSLGLWFSLIDELSKGPFGYQHIFLTGHFFLHHEPQTQIYDRFKAAYFHGSVMLDPNLVLVGTSKYEWRPEDMTEAAFDDRINDILAIDFGFDFGPLSLQVFPAVLSQAAVKMGEVFDRSADLNLWRAGPRLTFRNWQVELLGGFADLTGDSGCRRRQGCTSVQARRVFQAQEEAVLGWPGHVTHGSLAPAQIPTSLNLRLHGSPRRCTLSYSYNEAWTPDLRAVGPARRGVRWRDA